jgi:GT2 family glycosyltransferase
MARVGIIVTTHGAGAYLPAAVESVTAQTFTDWILVIVCDGAAGGAGAADRLASADRRIQVIRQARAGVAVARNRGLDLVGPRVEMVAFLDHDDRWLPQTLERLEGCLSAGSESIMGAHGIGRYIDASGDLCRPGELENHLRRRFGVEGRRLVEWPPGRPTGFANLAFSNCISVGTVLIRRAALDRAGGFDERAVPADDYDMWLRLSRLGDFAFIDEVVMEYRRGTAPTWIRPPAGLPYTRRKILAASENTAEQAMQAKHGYRICERWTVAHALSEAARLAWQKRYLASMRQLARAGLHAGAYVRGWPGSRA